MSELPDPIPPHPPWAQRVEVRVSLQLNTPVYGALFIEGLRLSVDRYIYDRRREHGGLEDWLRHEAFHHLRQNSTMTYVAIDGGL